MDFEEILNDIPTNSLGRAS